MKSVVKTFLFLPVLISSIYATPADSMVTQQNKVAEAVQKLTAAFKLYDNGKEADQIFNSIIKDYSSDEIIHIYNAFENKIGFSFQLSAALDSRLDNHSKNKFLPLMKQKFLEIAASNARVISAILPHNTDAIRELFPLIKDNFLALSISDYGGRIISSVVYYYPIETQELIKLAKQNFAALSADKNGCSIIECMVNKDTVQEFSDLIKHNFLNLIANSKGAFVIQSMTSRNPTVVKELLPLIEQNLKVLAGHGGGCHLIEDVVENNVDLAKKFALLTFEQGLDPGLFHKIIKTLPEQSQRNEIRQVLSGLHFTNDFNMFLKTVAYCGYFKKNNIKILERSPSMNHIIEHYEDFLDKYSAELKNPQIQQTIIAGLSKEKELIACGYVPFVHGRRRSYDFPTQVQAFLESLTANQPINNDFIPTHIKKRAADLEKEKAIREQLIKEGNALDSKNDSQGIERRQRLLFLNHFMFGNMDRDGSNSFKYMLSNKNADSIQIATKQVFDLFNLANHYKIYERKLKELEKEYNAISPYGQMLQIGITPEKVKKCVYKTRSGGPKVILKVSDTYSPDQIDALFSDHTGFPIVKNLKGETDRIDTVLGHLKTNPIDRTEFALVNTFDQNGGLNPHGMKISVLDPADYDPESLAKKIACEKKRNELFAQIERDYKTAKA